ncbi:MAG: hypothetical protein QOI96_1535 [Verrucomicrobiota bacterium]|jgi:hypothetical protein
MDDVDLKLARLLRSAAQGSEDLSPQTPFGFDTRVVALWRAGAANGSNGLGRLIRRVALSAVGVIVLASAAAFYQFKSDRDDDESYGNEFAIADNAIQSEMLR